MLAGIGGPESLLPDPGDTQAPNGIVSATSTGVGGGLFDLRDATSYTASLPKVTVTIGGAKLRGQDIVIGGASQANVAVASVGLGGGFASFGESNANADVTNTVLTSIASNADLFATHNIAITAKGIDLANGKGVNATGGLIAGADTDVTVKLGFDMKTSIDGTIVANRTLVIDSSAGFDARVYARSSSGGLGTDADANDDSGQGIRIGQAEHPALAETRILDGADIRAKLVYAAAGVGVGHGVDIANGNVTTDELLAKADAKATARAAALGADSDSAAYVRYSDTVRVVLEGNSEIEGDAVVLRASHEHVSLNADATASCACGGGDTDATAKVIFHLDSRVQADDSSVIRTASLLVEAYEFVGYHAHAHTSGGLLDGGDADADATVDPKRTIVWNADVYLLGEPNPLLIVDGAGKIIAKSDNVTVRANGVGPALQIDDVFAPGTTIVIDPIIYDQKPTALFVANHVDGVPSTISETNGVFFMQETWDSVKILNGSDRPVQLLGTGGLPNASINTLNASMSFTPEAVINISVDDGAELPGLNRFRFDVKHIFPATDVRIESVRGPPSMTACNGNTGPCDLTIFGDIVNIVGSTTVRNDRGNIFAGPAGPGLLLQQGVPRLRGRLHRDDSDPDPARPLPDHPHRRGRRAGDVQGCDPERRGGLGHVPRARDRPSQRDRGQRRRRHGHRAGAQGRPRSLRQGQRLVREHDTGRRRRRERRHLHAEQSPAGRAAPATPATRASRRRTTSGPTTRRTARTSSAAAPRRRV